MPMTLLQAMTEQIVPVSSEERIENLTDISVATGNVKSEFARKHQRSLTRHTKPEKRTASIAEIRAMGIQVDG